MNTLQAQYKGLFYATTAFVLWGLVPVYFKALVHVDEFEVLSHRILWSFVFLFFYIQYKKLWSQLKSRPFLAYLPYFASAILVSFNWFVFIWAVGQERILETSLGYFINPLVSVCLGMLFLGERLRVWQYVAVFFALAGVVNQLVAFGAIPWVAILLAVSFASYGLIRKAYPINASLGLFIETAIVLPFALVYLSYLFEGNELSFLHDSYFTDGLLLLAGFVTSVPLLLFASGTYFLSLKVMGMVQYITPSLSFMLAVFVYGEPFNQSLLMTFSLIWLGLVVFTIDGIKNARQNKNVKTG